MKVSAKVGTCAISGNEDMIYTVEIDGETFRVSHSHCEGKPGEYIGRVLDNRIAEQMFAQGVWVK